MVAVVTTTSIAVIIFALLTVGYLTFAIFNIFSHKAEIGSEIELAANRKEYYSDEELEGPRLERVQILGVLCLFAIAVMLPLYWVLEPSRQSNAVNGHEARLAGWGGDLFKPTAEGGFNCAGCHGNKGVGGSAPYTLIDPNTGQSSAVTWNAPALNTIFYRYSADEVRFILIYGRAFSPMSPWGVEGGGPMNEQQITTLIEYLQTIQIPPVGCTTVKSFDLRPVADGGTDPAICDGGQLPDTKQADITAAVKLAMDTAQAAGKPISEGQALFNLSLDSGAYSCARCHTKGWSWGDPSTSGVGALGPNLGNGSTVLHFANVQDQVAFITSGSTLGKKYGIQGQGSGRMPAFGHLLTDEQIKAITEYVRSL
jgi:mono/diheme cytochrome c family protein